MDIQQLIYTSCKKGINGRSGFQVYSLSAGITDEEKREIEAHCVYIPPVNLPSQPSKEEIHSLFPKTLSYFKLSGGKVAVASIVYSGKDYSGRYGNYYCHVFVFETCDAPPITLFGSKDFSQELVESEEDNKTIELLPVWSKPNLIPGSEINVITIIAFAKEHKEEVINLLHQVLQAKENGKRLIFSSNIKDIPFYMGAIQLLLPAQFSNYFTFTTYTQQPTDVNYFISAIIDEGARFSAFSIKNHPKIIFIDLKEDLISNSIQSIYFQVLLDSLNEGSTKGFIQFLSEFKEMNLVNMEKAATVYRNIFIKSNLEELTMEQFSEILDFSIKQGSKKIAIQVFDRLIASFAKQPFEQVQKTLVYLLDYSTQLQDSELQGQATNVFVKEVMNNADQPLPNLKQWVEKQRKNIPMFLWAKIFMLDENVNLLCSNKDQLPKETVQFFGELFLECMVYQKDFENMFVGDFVRKFTESSTLMKVMSVLNNQHLDFPKLVLLVYKKGTSENLMNLCLEFIEKDQKTREDFWDQVVKHHCGLELLTDLLDLDLKSKNKAKMVIHAAMVELFPVYKERTNSLYHATVEKYYTLLGKGEIITVVSEWMFLLSHSGGVAEIGNRVEKQLSNLFINGNIKSSLNLFRHKPFYQLISSLNQGQVKSPLLNFIGDICEWRNRPKPIIFPELPNINNKARENLVFSTSIILLENSQTKDLKMVADYIASSGQELGDMLVVIKLNHRDLLKKAICVYFMLSKPDSKEVINTLLQDLKRSTKMNLINNVQRSLTDAGLIDAGLEVTKLKEEFIIESQSPLIRKIKGIFNKSKRNEL